jgi:hypothetical protein
MRDDRGSILPMVPVLIIVLLLLGGLVVDANRALNARSQAQSYAEEAARAGATAIDPAAADLTLEPALARQRVEAFCRTVLVNSRDEVTGCTYQGISDTTTHCAGGPQVRHIVVEARVTMRIPTTLLGLVGIQELHATGEARARPFEGITAADAC